MFRELYGKLTIGDTLTVSGRYSKLQQLLHQQCPGQSHRPGQYARSPFCRRPIPIAEWEKVDAELKAYTNYFENDSKESLIEIVQGPVGPTPTPLKTELDQDNWRYGLEAKFDTYLYDKHALTLGGSFEYDDAAETAFDLAAIYFGAQLYG